MEEGECADTTIFHIEAAKYPSNPLDTLILCRGVPTKIGFPPGLFSQIEWWNGKTGDSTLLIGENTGYYKVTAEKDGCLYRGEFKVSVKPGVDFPANLPD